MNPDPQRPTLSDFVKFAVLAAVVVIVANSGILAPYIPDPRPAPSLDPISGDPIEYRSPCLAMVAFGVIALFALVKIYDFFRLLITGEWEDRGF